MERVKAVSVAFHVPSVPEYCLSREMGSEAGLVLLWRRESWNHKVKSHPVQPEGVENSGSGSRFPSSEGTGLLGSEQTPAGVEAAVTGEDSAPK